MTIVRLMLFYVGGMTSLVWGDILVFTNPSLAHTLSDENHLELALVSQFEQSHSFQGRSKVGTLFVNTNANTDHSIQRYPHLYYLSPSWNSWRFGLTAGENYVDSAYLKNTNPQAKAQVSEYNLDYQTLNASLSYELYQGLYLALGTSITYGEGDKTLIHPLGAYHLHLTGDATGHSYFASMTGFISPELALWGQYKTATKMNLSGKVDGTFGATSYSAAASYPAIIPSEWEMGGIYRWNDSIMTTVSYKKRQWKHFTTQNLDVDNALLESQLGTPLSSGYKNTNIYRMMFTFSHQKHTCLTGIGYSSSSIDNHYADFSTTAYPARFYQLNYSYQMSKMLSLGWRSSYIHRPKQTLNSSFLQGTMNPSEKTFLTFFSNIKF